MREHPELFTVSNQLDWQQFDKIGLLHELSHDLLNNVGEALETHIELGSVIDIEGLENKKTLSQIERETMRYTLLLYSMYRDLGFNLAPDLTEEQVRQIQEDFVETYESYDVENLKIFIS